MKQTRTLSNEPGAVHMRDAQVGEVVGELRGVEQVEVGTELQPIGGDRRLLQAPSPRRCLKITAPRGGITMSMLCGRPW